MAGLAANPHPYGVELQGLNGLSLPLNIFHRRCDVKPPGIHPFSFQKPLRHSTAHERVFERQFVDSPH